MQGIQPLRHTKGHSSNSTSAEGSESNATTVPNLDLFAVCGRSGQLICCDFCPRSYHRKCLKGIEVPKGIQAFACSGCRSGSYGFSMNDLDLSLSEDLLRFVEVFCGDSFENTGKPTLGAILQYLEVTHPSCSAQLAHIASSFVNSAQVLRQSSDQEVDVEKVTTSARLRQFCLNIERVIGTEVCMQVVPDLPSLLKITSRIGTDSANTLVKRNTTWPLLLASLPRTSTRGVMVVAGSVT